MQLSLVTAALVGNLLSQSHCITLAVLDTGFLTCMPLGLCFRVVDLSQLVLLVH